MRRRVLALPILFLCVGATACRSDGETAAPGEPAPAGADVAAASSSGNPFAGATIHRGWSQAEQEFQKLQQSDPEKAALLGKIATQPQASWYGEWSGDVQAAVKQDLDAAERAGALALMVLYNVPHRDCGLYSAGGATSDESYIDWVERVAAGIGDRKAAVVLEPDAIPLLTQCLSPEDQQKRLQLIRRAVEILEGLPNVAVYIDAGHSSWVPAAEMAERLRAAGIEKARGFALNTSNYRENAELIAYGKSVIAALGTDTHFIIDSSRNGNGPAPAENEDWCNPEGRALGVAPTADTGEAVLDAYMWIKKPGESDGTCKGGPPAGQWYEARALELAKNAKW